MSGCRWVITSSWMKVKEESEKVGLKLNIHKTKIMASGPITSWQIDGETVEIVRLYFLGAPKSLQIVTAAMKLRLLLLGRKAVRNLDNILKSRDIIFPAKVHIVKAMVFPIVMYGCESWTTKKAECRKLKFLNCGVWKHSWESLGLQDQTSQS